MPTSTTGVADDNSSENYDVKGRLTSIVSRGGWAQDVGYDAAGRVSTITERVSGRFLTLSYDGKGRLSELQDPARNHYRYGYDGNNRLTSVAYPDATPDDATDDPRRLYQYEDSRFPHALTGITDENGVRYASYRYDGQGRGVITEHAGAAERYQLTYNGDGSTTVTDPLGSARRYTYQTLHGVPKSGAQDQPAGAGCAAAASSSQYDANGNPVSRTDFNGNTTTYVFDSARNLETARTEAAGTAQARTVLTQWHPVFRLPAQIDQPGRRMTFDYDEKGNLLTRRVIDTATGQARTWQYTYNSVGQVLSIDGPRTDVADITRYDYYADATPTHRPGDLRTITNALGQVTTFASYDAHGRPLTSTDQNGRILALLYDERGLLLERNDGGEVTRFGYDKTGQLLTVTEPDGNRLALTYDDAHRLTGIADSLGNRIQYTLDGLANRIREEARDPAGTLTATVSRVYDPLNRLQQHIGAQ
ncbi:MAG: repeat-associated core domain protein [Proteobacteria bacterium]|nr:repeat-associated core domain protein [Pseudomonadota bacterium]